MGLGTSIAILVVVAVLGYIFIHVIGISNSINLLNNLGSENSALGSCVSQVNSASAILIDKLPSGSSTSIVNTTVFGTIGTNQSIAAVQSWANEWGTIGSLISYKGCFDPWAVGRTYFCNDLHLAHNQNMSVEGVVLKVNIKGTYGSSTSVEPVLCGNRALLPNSTGFIRGGGSILQ